MNRQFKEAAGSLYCIDQHLLVEKKADGFTIPNGLAWSPDNKTMYHIESTKRIVRAYEFNPDTAHIHFIKIAIKVPEELGSPDGMCMDDEGMLWIAHWDGFGVYRWNPLTGQLLDKIEVPVPQVSCCAFGGENLDQLFITTARQDFTPQLEEKYPESGSVFVAKMKVRGSMKNKFYRKTKLPIESRLLH
jgi:sugar lactone lactonase YvrE